MLSVSEAPQEPSELEFNRSSYRRRCIARGIHGNDRDRVETVYSVDEAATSAGDYIAQDSVNVNVVSDDRLSIQVVGGQTPSQDYLALVGIRRSQLGWRRWRRGVIGIARSRPYGDRFAALRPVDTVVPGLDCERLASIGVEQAHGSRRSGKSLRERGAVHKDGVKDEGPIIYR